MLWVQMPLLSAALPAVIYLEASLLRRWYSLDWPAALKPVILANAASTLLGIPFLWITLVLAQPGVAHLLEPSLRPSLPRPWIELLLKTSWMDPMPAEHHWMIPVAFLILLIPAFFMTIAVEAPFYRRAFAGRTTPFTPNQATWRLHAYSYALLAGFSVLLLAGSILTHHLRPPKHRLPSSHRPTPQAPPVTR